MQDDLDSILKEAKDVVATEEHVSDSEVSPSQETGKEAAATTENPAGEIHASVPFAEQVKAVHDKAEKEKKEFKKNVWEMQEQDPQLIKKIKLVGIGIVALLVIFAALVLGGKKDTQTQNGTTAQTADKGQAVQESDEDRIKAMQDINDKLRIDNMTTMANLAVVYHLEQKADLPVSATFVKLNENNPVSEFLQEVLLKYGEPAGLLFDPTNPAYYYGYRSVDGKNIEFSARIENETSELCRVGVSPCIYTKVITEADMTMMSEDLEKYK